MRQLYAAELAAANSAENVLNLPICYRIVAHFLHPKLLLGAQLAARRSRREAVFGRAQLLAKKGASGRMQRPTELVPILYGPIWSVKVRVKVRIVAATA